MDARMFPIQTEHGAAPHPMLIPWSVAEKAYSVAARYGGQSIERLAELGGFAPSEMDKHYPGWREECDEIARLRAECSAVKEALGNVARALTFQSPPGPPDPPPSRGSKCPDCQAVLHWPTNRVAVCLTGKHLHRAYKVQHDYGVPATLVRITDPTAIALSRVIIDAVGALPADVAEATTT